MQIALRILQCDGYTTLYPKQNSSELDHMPTFRQLSEEEQALLKEWMQDVQPLNHPRNAPPQKRSNAISHKKSAILASSATRTPPESLLLSLPQDYSRYQKTDSQFFKTTVPHGIQKQLREGTLSIGAQLDLHHHTLKQAEASVPHFLWHCQQQQIEVALIIHGKGKILKHWLQYCLPKLAIVLAFCEACPQHGDQGSMYVLLQTLLCEEKYR